MSLEMNNTRCEFTREVLISVKDAYRKAADAGVSSLAPAYAQVALELRRILARHATHCPICIEEDSLTDAPTALTPTFGKQASMRLGQEAA